MNSPSTPDSRRSSCHRSLFDSKTPLTPHTPSRMRTSRTQHSTPYTPLSGIYARTISTAATTPCSEKPGDSPPVLKAARPTIADDIPDWRAAALKYQHARASQSPSAAMKNAVSNSHECGFLFLVLDCGTHTCISSEHRTNVNLYPSF